MTPEAVSRVFISSFTGFLTSEAAAKHKIYQGYFNLAHVHFRPMNISTVNIANTRLFQLQNLPAQLELVEFTFFMISGDVMFSSVI